MPVALWNAACTADAPRAGEKAGGDEAARPAAFVVELVPAPLLSFPGANRRSPGEPGDCDCNSPAHWDGDTLHVFNSSGHPWRSSGAGLFHLTAAYDRIAFDNEVNGGRWFECTWKDGASGTLYGWYHLEPGGLCVDPTRDRHLTAPRIGAARSRDNGLTWEDLGVVLTQAGDVRCDTANFYFAGGNGDFSAMLDAAGEYLYLFISTYGDPDEQGVSVARMAWRDRDAPVGEVKKWHNGAWNEPGLGGRATPIFPAAIDWHRPDADAFWGPSIHWNTHLGTYVILLNRALSLKSQRLCSACFETHYQERGGGG